MITILLSCWCGKVIWIFSTLEKNPVCLTGPAKINHMSANYTKLYFGNIFSSECGIPFPSISEESSLNSTVVTEILSCLYKQFVSYDRAKTEKISYFCAHMVDFCRPGHILQSIQARLNQVIPLQHLMTLLQKNCRPVSYEILHS